MAGLSQGSGFSAGGGFAAGNGISAGSGLSGSLSSSPVLSLIFAGATTLDSRITFSRPSLATMYDSTGKLTYAPNNILLRSNEFNVGAWNNVTATLTSGVSDPLGGTNAWTMTAAGANSTIYQALSVTAGVNFVHSLYIRRRTGTGVIRFRSPATPASDTDITAQVSSSWSRVYLAGAAGASTTYLFLQLATSGDAVDIAWGQAEAVTYQTTPSTYTATTASAYYGPRFDYNPSTLAARGLLIEEARTNSSLYSEDLSNAWWTKTGASVSGGNTAPDGTSNAYKLVEDTANSPHYIGRLSLVPATVSTVYTMSLYVKTAGRSRARFYIYGFNNYTGFLDFSTKSVVSYTGGTSPTVTFTDINNGYIRVTITDTATFAELQFDGIYLVSTGTTFSYTGDGTSGMILWGLSREAGSFATSYIPTGSSSVARSADSVSMTGSNFSSWYNQSEGTFAFNYTKTSASSIMMQAVNAGGGNYHNFYSYSLFTVCETVNTTQQGLTQLTTSTAGVAQRVAYGYKANDFAGCVDGTSPVVDTSGSVPNDLNRLSIGLAIVGSGSLNGWIASLTYYRTRLSNAQLQAIST